MISFLFDFWNLRQTLGLLDVKCLYRYSIVFALAALLWPPLSKAEIVNLSEILMHFSRKSSITRLFETPYIKPLYNKRKLMNGAITWRWADMAKWSRLAARGRQSWLSFFAVFAQYLRNVSVYRSEIFTTNVPGQDATFIFYTLFWYHAPFDLKKLKTRIVKKFQGWYLLIFFRNFLFWKLTSTA